MSKSHDPVPWTASIDHHDPPNLTIYSGFRTIAHLGRANHASDVGNFELIVRSVNSYYAALRALEDIVQHAYDDDTSIEDIKADFEHMRAMASQAIARMTE